VHQRLLDKRRAPRLARRVSGGHEYATIF
jgi:hypothetical protein